MRHGRMRGRRVQQRLIRLARLHRPLHGVVDLQDDALGAVFAVRDLVLALDDGESVHDVVHVVSFDAVEMEVGGVQLAAQEETAGFVPTVGRGEVRRVA
ncbi:MAG: hypothetical protein GY759_10610 [Chloroflexi bacterium]|nr:hypothetical protein [Chloroflexota bacterium]